MNAQANEGPQENPGCLGVNCAKGNIPRVAGSAVWTCGGERKLRSSPETWGTVRQGVQGGTSTMWQEQLIFLGRLSGENVCGKEIRRYIAEFRRKVTGPGEAHSLLHHDSSHTIRKISGIVVNTIARLATPDTTVVFDHHFAGTLAPAHISSILVRGETTTRSSDASVVVSVIRRHGQKFQQFRCGVQFHPLQNLEADNVALPLHHHLLPLLKGGVIEAFGDTHVESHSKSHDGGLGTWVAPTASWNASLQAANSDNQKTWKRL
ncbi:hypothetical protein EDD15DRAFT_2192508 [Pisolithus albus]|nr:hypothetical protein EDD15DRAFT_2192508 [Pisolithus albus]